MLVSQERAHLRILNKGETASFDVAIENKGSSSANTVAVSLSTTDSYVTVRKSNLTADTIDASTIQDTDGYTSGSSSFLSSTYTNDFVITADINTTDGHIATIDMNMTDGYGNSWTDSFTVTVLPNN